MRYFIVLMLGLLVTGSALADTIVFRDTTDSLSIIVNGQILPNSGEICPTIEECAGNGVDLTQPAGTVITGGLGNFNIYEDSGLTTVSDTLSLIHYIDPANGDVGVLFVFISDVEGLLTPLPNATSLVEDGTAQIATTVTFSNGVSSQEFGFQSDVPEPSSLLLLSTGSSV